ncbi:MAG: PepSY-associated TM helix domain-containing protein [Thermomonas sp.]|uniref:PepSY-associated TM helix domain-containing protein n=1 Tax=Thermomonas sp. TaxID=1971895 RepID=UPI0039E2ECD5
MKAATLRSFLAVHTWIGLITGMALFIAFYAGAVTVFTHELQDWQQPASQDVQTGDALAQSQALLDAVLAQHGDDEGELFLTLPGTRSARAAAYWFDEGNGSRKEYVLDDAGKLTEANTRAGFVQFIYDLHFTAGLPRTVGTYLFGIVCVLYGLALVSGVVIYAPVFFRDLFALRVGKNLKRMWQDAHNVVGMLSLPFHVVFAWSGAVLCIGFILLAPFQFLVYDNKLLTILEHDLEASAHVQPAGVRAPMLPLADVLRRAKLELPELEPDSFGFHDPGDANAQVAVFGHADQRRLASAAAVVLDAASGKFVAKVEPTQYTPGRAFLNSLTALHFGNFGHYAVKWLYFLLGLAGAFLFYGGNLLWIEARRKRRQVEQPFKTRVMAALTLGVCLGCMAGVSATLLAGAWLPEAWVSRSYFVVFFASILWACIRPPARAGHELLWLCALLTAAIPFAAWLGNGEHLFAAFARGHWHRFFVDATALLMALAFWWMARATLRRGRKGDPNSVWALG